jgi:hypothetical protein
MIGPKSQRHKPWVTLENWVNDSKWTTSPMRESSHVPATMQEDAAAKIDAAFWIA